MTPDTATSSLNTAEIKLPARWKRDDATILPVRPAIAPRLVAVAISTVTATYALPAEGAVTIGRGQEAMVRIADHSVSRVHAILRLTPDLSIKDVSSTNGTSVDGQRLEADRWSPLQVGHPIVVGAVTMVLLPCARPGALDGAPQPIAHEATERVTSPRPIENDGQPVIADATMRRLHGMARQAAATDISVLLLGETGSGKEIFAEAVHRHSPRADKPFLRVHCAAVPENLLESELFGYEKGAFSGATAAKPGLFEAADGGTVFLDEIGDMPLSLQAKLLRVLEDRRVMRLGSLRAKSIDVRFVAATNRNLEEDASRGTFRLDLYYRLNGFCLEIPPLRARTAEIEPLARLFLRRAGRADRRGRPLGLSADAVDLLARYAWPGNVRELRNVIERAIILAGDAAEITPLHLPVERLLRDAVATAPTAPDLAAAVPMAAAPAYVGERERIIAVLAQCGGNQSAAAKLLGMSRNTLIARVRAFGLPRPHAARQRAGAIAART